MPVVDEGGEDKAHFQKKTAHKLQWVTPVRCPV